MGIIINQSIRNAVISYSGIILGFISTVILFPHILGAERFGLTRTLIAIMTICVQLVNVGIPNSIIKFFPALSDKTKNPPGLYWIFIIPPLIGFIIYGIIFLFLKDFILGLYVDSSLLTNYYHFIIPLVFSLAAFGILNSFLTASLDTVFASFLRDVLIRVVVIIDLILFYFEIINFDQFVLIFVLNYSLQYILLFIYALKKRYINFRPSRKPIDKLARKDISQYSFFAFFSGFTMILVGNIDLIMVDIFKGLEQTGVYAVALYVGAIISIPRRSIAKISFPIISNSFKKNDFDNIRNIYTQSSLNQLLVGLLIYIGILSNLENLYSLLPNTFADGATVIIIIGLANLFDISTGANGQIIISSQYYKFDFIASLILMITSIILNLLLIPIYGLTGAAIATASSIFIYNAIKMVFVWMKFKMHPFKWSTLAIITLGISILFLISLVPMLFNNYIDIVLRSSLITLTYMAFVWVFNLSDEINSTIKRLIARIGL